MLGRGTYLFNELCTTALMPYPAIHLDGLVFVYNDGACLTFEQWYAIHWWWSNEIWIQKMILNLENSLTALTKKVLQDIKTSFEYAHLDIKIYWILPDTLWNSTTVSRLASIIKVDIHIIGKVRLKLFWLRSTFSLFTSKIYANKFS